MGKATGNPQIENGFTRIANELLEAVITMRFRRISTQSIVLLVMRNTYGWGGRLTWDTTLAEVADLANLKKTTAHAGLQEAVECGVIVRVRKPKKAIQLSLNKHYPEWREMPKKKTLSTTVNELKTGDFIHHGERTVHQGELTNEEIDASAGRSGSLKKDLKKDKKEEGVDQAEFYEIAKSHGFDFTVFERHFTSGQHAHQFCALLKLSADSLDGAFAAIAKRERKFLPKRPGAWIESIQGELVASPTNGRQTATLDELLERQLEGENVSAELAAHYGGAR